VAKECHRGNALSTVIAGLGLTAPSAAAQTSSGEPGPSEVKEALPPSLAQHNDTRIGDVAVVFPANDIWRMYSRIKEAGYVMISPPVTMIERPPMKQQSLEMMFRDTDGVLVKLVQAGLPE
jgi:hypothetical protein